MSGEQTTGKSESPPGAIAISPFGKITLLSILYFCKNERLFSYHSKPSTSHPYNRNDYLQCYSVVLM